MKSKSTDELRHEIKIATDIEDYLQNNKESLTLQSLPAYLNLLLARKGISRAKTVKGSQLSRAYVYQIFAGEKTPSRDKLIALAFGLCLSGEETPALLKVSKNQELYVRDRRDAIIFFALEQKKTILEVNDLLFEHGLQPLGVPEE